MAKVKLEPMPCPDCGRPAMVAKTKPRRWVAVCGAFTGCGSLRVVYGATYDEACTRWNEEVKKNGDTLRKRH
jgi:hypothetical protein